jgi:hypothetical protein
VWGQQQIWRRKGELCTTLLSELWYSQWILRSPKQWYNGECIFIICRVCRNLTISIYSSKKYETFLFQNSCNFLYLLQWTLIPRNTDFILCCKWVYKCLHSVRLSMDCPTLVLFICDCFMQLSLLKSGFRGMKKCICNM